MGPHSLSTRSETCLMNKYRKIPEVGILDSRQYVSQPDSPNIAKNKQAD